LGIRETPTFVDEDFYNLMKEVTTMNQLDFRMLPTTINYRIPNHMVVERPEITAAMDRYEIHLDDTFHIPRCRRYQSLQRLVFKRKYNSASKFDQFRCITEEYCNQYFLVTPNAMYYNVEIYTDWTCSYVLYDNMVWTIHFRKVFVDPHDARHTVWFHGTPKYQIEIISNQDFREREIELRETIRAILPRAFRWF
jgi:hypothetical protein